MNRVLSSHMFLDITFLSLSEISIGFGKWHGFSSIFRVPGRVFRAFNHLNFHQLLSSLTDTLNESYVCF